MGGKNSSVFAIKRFVLVAKESGSLLKIEKELEMMKIWLRQGRNKKEQAWK